MQMWRSWQQSVWLSLLVWLVASLPAQAYQLRVAVAKKISQIEIASSTVAIVSDGTGRKIGELMPLKTALAAAERNEIKFGDVRVGQLWVTPQAGGYIWIGDRWYRGALQVIPDGKGLTAIERVNIEQYLYSVLGAEMSTTFPIEALKAQAVAARTYALYRSQGAAKKPFDLDSTQDSQVYRGISSEASTTQAAVNATAGQIMTYQGKPILAAFHSASGGHTENVEDIWSSNVPYLRGVPDYDLGTPGYEWTKSVSRGELSKSLKVSNVRSISAERLTQYGSVLSLKVIGNEEKTLTGKELRTALKLRSLRFTISPTPDGFVFNGFGYGHALGMSQWGAYSMAQQGMTYTTILAHYYRGVELGRLAHILPKNKVTGL
jgi:stage II sporulation protein D